MTRAGVRAALWLAVAGVLCAPARAAAVRVVTDPPTAGVRAEGANGTCTTGPDGICSFPDCAAGSYEFSFQLRGITLKREFSIAERRASLPVRVVEAKISTNFPGAQVFIDDVAVGRTSATGDLLFPLLPGRRYFRVELPGYVSDPPDVTIVDDPQPGFRLSFILTREQRSFMDALTGGSALTWILTGLLLATVGAAGIVAYRLLRPKGPLTSVNFDRYRIEGVLGHGGMATVYRARDTLAGAAPDIALKVLADDRLGDEDLVRKFLREGEILKQLGEQDPAAPLVRVHHFGWGGGEPARPFIAMELIEGQSLQDYWREQKRLPAAEALHLVAGVARALVPAHRAGVFHRDLTPDNVLLTSEPRDGFGLRLIDFGVARHEYATHKTLDGSIAGKPPYMSPEQCEGAAVDGRSDIYALGIMLYALIVGQPPFSHPSPFEVMRMHREEPVPESPLIPGPVAALLATVLSKNPAGRPATVDAFLELLRMTSKDLPDSHPLPPIDEGRP